MNGTTPCGELGYRVGDRFLVVGDNMFEVGSEVELIKDDRTSSPKFRLVEGRARYARSGRDLYENLKYVSPKMEVSDLESTIKGSGISVTVNPDGSVVVCDGVRGRSMDVGTLAKAFEVVSAMVEFSKRVDELGDWT